MDLISVQEQTISPVIREQVTLLNISLFRPNLIYLLLLNIQSNVWQVVII